MKKEDENKMDSDRKDSILLDSKKSENKQACNNC